MAFMISTATEVILINTKFKSGTLSLPSSTDIPFRLLTLKDSFGNAGRSSITVTTTVNDRFENGTQTMTLSHDFGNVSFYAGKPGYWYTIGGTLQNSLQVGTLSTGLVTSPLNLGISSYIAFQKTGLLTELPISPSSKELLIFEGTSLADRIRLATTGEIRFDTATNATTLPSIPTMILREGSVGIGVSSPQSLLDVGGTGRFIHLSTQALQISSINGFQIQGIFASSIQGLGSSGFISTSQLQSSIANLASIGFISSSQIISTIAGLGSAGFISTASLLSTVDGLVEIPELTSTVRGLGTLGYISSSQLFSSIRGLSTGYTFFLATSSLQTNTISTQRIFLAGEKEAVLFQSTGLFYYNQFIIGGSYMFWGEEVIF